MICYKLGTGIDSKYGSETNIGFSPVSQLPIVIWHGRLGWARSGTSIGIHDIERLKLAFECTKTMWLFDFLKAFPPGTELTYAMLNAEYIKHHGTNMPLDLDSEPDPR